jgi:hypothetical protein
MTTQHDETQRATNAQRPVATDPNAWLAQAVADVAPKPATDQPPTTSELLAFSGNFIVRRRSSFTGAVKPHGAP